MVILRGGYERAIKPGTTTTMNRNTLTSALLPALCELADAFARLDAQEVRLKAKTARREAKRRK